MKHFWLGAAFATIALAQHPKISECFKVQELLRADEEHYWATWTNACPYTIDSVYVLVGFADHAAKELAKGVWSLHFVTPGTHRTIRLSAPGRLSDFASVHKQKITADMEEAFGREPTKPPPPAISPVEMTAVKAYRRALSKDHEDAPRVRTVAAVLVSDPGEGAYRYEPPPEAPEVPSIAALLQFVTATAILAPLEAIPLPEAASFRTDFPDPWQAVLSPEELSVSPAPRASFVRFVSEEKPLFW